MTDKEKELQAEAIGYYRKRIAELEMTVGTLRNFSNEQATCIERLEKENKELEKDCEETQELLDKQIEATYKLDKENAELKKDKKELCHSISEGGKACVYLNEQLTNAKELLERLLITSCNSDVLSLLPNCSEVLKVRVEAEQFLKYSEVEK